MRGQLLVSAARARSTPPRRLTLLLLSAAMAFAIPALAQSTLGTIRGTVTDPTGLVVPKAAVQVVDQATGVPRIVETDAEGRYEAANLRPGTYRVEVVTTSFRKAEKTGIAVRTGAVALVDFKLEVGPVAETVTVSAEPINNITLESQAVSVGLDEQQIRDLPRNSRDIQSFLLLNPNVLGGSDDMQFLGGRTYGVSYIQDGQASTNAIFGTIGNSAPGLDSIGEVQVLSNSYSAEYGGLAGVVVTTKRGGNQYRGSGFYDFNFNGLNALTYDQKYGLSEEDLATLRSDPNADTHEHRWGLSFGGPIKSGKTFFFASYEGSNQKAIYGGGTATVPTAAMRAGDFRGTAIKPIDPLTGEPFPDQVIPAGRIDASATKIMNFFWPLPNAGTLSNGYGRYRQFVPETRNRERADLRIDHEASPKDSIFLRASYQWRSPNSITFEGGSALTNLGILNQNLNTASVIGGWTKILSPTVVNEFRIGYNYDNSYRQSNYLASQVASELGLENAPSLGADRRGFPQIQFSNGSNRPSNISDAARNVDRTLTQNAFSISDNATFVMGSHSLKAGGLWNRNMATDGFGLGVNFRGRYRFRTTNTGNAFTDFLLGMPYDAADQVTSRGPLQGHSDDFAVFAQDDWRVSRDLTVFLGLRYEVVGQWHENSDMLANWVKADGGHHVVPTAQVATALPPGLQLLDRTLIADQSGYPSTLINADKNNFSPRVGFAWRVGGTDKTVLRGGFGLFHPTVAIQGTRDLLATNEFRYTNTYRGASLQDAFSAGTPTYDIADFGNQGLDPNLQSPDVYQYNLSLEREFGDFGVRASYIGSTMRKLLVSSMYNYLPAMTQAQCEAAGYCRPGSPFDVSNPDDITKLPYYPYGTWANVTENRGEGQLHAFQVELKRRWKRGLAVDVAYTYAHSSANAPDTGDSTIGVYAYNIFDLEMDRGPDPNVVKHRLVANATWDIPVGKNRSHGANMPGWADALFGGWTVSTIVQARSGINLTPFFSGFYTTSPWNTGQSLDGVGNIGCCAWKPDQTGNLDIGASRDQWFNQAAYAMPAEGQYGNAGKGSLTGPGTWVVNFAFYKDIVATGRLRLQLSAMLDNAFNHPQFFPSYGSGFTDLTDALVNDVPDNGTTGVLGADTIANAEGFSPGRVIRIGIRATF
jgi:hypothetical protein